MKWQTVKLGEICELNIGKTPSRADKSYWDNQKISENVWLSIADLSNLDGITVYDSKEYITDSGACLFKPVKAGTLIMSFKLSIGKLAITGRDLYTNEAIVGLPIRYKDRLDIKFLYYYLKFYDWDKESGNDVKVKGKTLNKAKLQEIPVPLPPIEVQQKIVAKLDALFAEIDTAAAAARANAANAAALFQSYLTAVFERGDARPAAGGTVKWQTVKIKDICEFVRGLTYSKKDEVDFSGNAVLRATNVDLSSNKLDLSEIRYISDSVNIQTDKKVRQNDILICTASGSKSHLGKVALIEESLNMAFGGFMGVLRVKPNADAKFLFAFLKSDIFLSHISKSADGANINNLRFSQFEDLELILPPTEVQQKTVSELDALSAQTDKMKAAYIQKEAELVSLKQSVLRQAFNGTLIP